jgi:sulfate adenylyltransferase
MVNEPERQSLIPPGGGSLINLIVDEAQLDELTAHAASLPSLQLSERAVCDLELLAVGAFSPLSRFMGEADYRRVLDEMRLGGGDVFPIPITLPVPPNSDIRLDGEIALRDATNELIALMTVEEIYEWDVQEVSKKVFGTEDPRHPLISEMHGWGKLNVSGALRVLNLPRHYDFKELRLTPEQVRAKLSSYGHRNIVAFQTRNPLHRGHEEMVKRAISQVDGMLLLHPAVGMTKPGDVEHFSRVRTYKAWSRAYPEPSRILLSLLHLAMRLAGPREALWHALIRRNYGANYFIVGRDHASPGLDSQGKPFYGPYDAQELVQQYSEEIGVGVLSFQELVYLPEEQRYEEVSRLTPETKRVSLSGTQVREEYLNRGVRLPDWFMHTEVSELLAEAYPPLHRQGICLWFTGLSGAGKSTTAELLTTFLQERGRQVTILDGDVVRTHLSKGLGFSKEDRDTNIKRIGYVASELVRHGGVAVCAAVSPYRVTRNDVRNMVGGENFIEVFVDTPLEVCEQRDTKGFYSKARSGQIKNFTGIDDPYEEPLHAEITLDTVNNSIEENARAVLSYLIKRGFVRDDNM